MNNEEISDLIEQLSRLIAAPPAVTTQDSARIIFRKKAVEGMLDIHQASQKLGCPLQFLKSKIPCSDYTYTEIEGKKEIQGYYWSRELIDRLCQIKSGGVKPEDLAYVADECCDGDRNWAEEILVALGTPRTAPKAGGGSPSPGVSKQPAKSTPREHPRHPRKKKP